jgi:hypothetical protein
MSTKEQAHTAGPWKVERIEYSKGLDTSFEIRAGSKLIAQTIMAEKGEGWRNEIIATDEANVHLMAASPDMLAELRKQVDWLQHIRPQLTGKVPGSVITGLDQSVKYMTASMLKATGAAR